MEGGGTLWHMKHMRRFGYSRAIGQERIFESLGFTEKKDIAFGSILLIGMMDGDGLRGG